MELALAPNVCQHVAIITVATVRFSYRNLEFNVAKARGLHKVVGRARWLGSRSGHCPKSDLAAASGKCDHSSYPEDIGSCSLSSIEEVDRNALKRRFSGGGVPE